MTIKSGIEMLSLEAQLANGPGLIHPVILFDHKHVVLVDTGLPGMDQQILEFAVQANIPFSDLDTVMITHSDMDHIGCLSALRRHTSKSFRVMAHAAERPYIECDLPPIRLAQMERGLKTLEGDFKIQMTVLCENLRANYKNLKVQVDESIIDGQHLDLAGGIEVIHTPGHTPGHICLYLKEEKLLIAGDAFNVENHELVPCPIFTRTDPAYYIQSVKKLSGYDIQTVLCFHGGLYNQEVNKRLKEISESLEA